MSPMANDLCDQPLIRSACASLQSDHGLHCSLIECLRDIVLVAVFLCLMFVFSQLYDTKGSKSYKLNLVSYTGLLC